MDENEEYRLSRIKDKRRKKHYSIKIGDEDIKIINHFFKRSVNRFEDVELLVLISNIRFPVIERCEVLISIPEGDHHLEILGKLNHGFISAGNYTWAYTVIHKLSVSLPVL